MRNNIKFIGIRDHGASFRAAEFEFCDKLYVGDRVFRLNEEALRLRINNIKATGGNVDIELTALDALTGE